jgi:two-component system response regulator NreC
MTEKIKLFVCDNHALFRRGLIAVFLTYPAIEVVGEAGNGREAVEKIKLAHPDVVLMDISMPEMNGLEATRRIVQFSTETKVLILSMHDEDDLIMQCLEAGAAGYVLKDAPSAQLVDAVKRTFHGEKYMSPGLRTEAVDEFLRNAGAPDTGDGLSSRERDILKLLAEGSSVKEIAFRLRLPVKSVEVHQRTLMRKTNAQDRAELVEYAIKREIARISSAEPRGSQQPGKKAA